MIYLQFLIGLIMFTFGAWASYYAPFKNSAYFYPAFLSTSLLSTWAWAWCARTTLDPSKLVMRGLYWDVLLATVYLAVPFAFFHAKITTNQGIGIAMIFLGLILTKF